MSTNANNKTQIRQAIEDKLVRYFGVHSDEATPEQIYKAVALNVKDTLSSKRGKFREDV